VADNSFPGFYINYTLVDQYCYSLSNNPTIMVSNKHPVIGIDIRSSFLTSDSAATMTYSS